jgi:hypothetical protein
LIRANIRTFSALPPEVDPGLVLDVKSDEAPLVFAKVSELLSVESVVTAHDEMASDKIIAEKRNKKVAKVSMGVSSVVIDRLPFPLS